MPPEPPPTHAPAPAPPPAAAHAARSTARDRLTGLALAALASAPLVTAAGLSADPAGHGTHLQLGMRPCGFLASSGLPCATCGMTTAFTHAADGHLLAAAAVQPAGTLLALLCAVVAIVGAYAAFTGLAVGRLLGALVRGRVVLAAIAVLLIAWGYTAWRFSQLRG